MICNLIWNPNRRREKHRFALLLFDSSVKCRCLIYLFFYYPQRFENNAFMMKNMSLVIAKWYVLHRFCWDLFEAKMKNSISTEIYAFELCKTIFLGEIYIHIFTCCKMGINANKNDETVISIMIIKQVCTRIYTYLRLIQPCVDKVC